MKKIMAIREIAKSHENVHSSNFHLLCSKSMEYKSSLLCSSVTLMKKYEMEYSLKKTHVRKTLQPQENRCKNVYVMVKT